MTPTNPTTRHLSPGTILADRFEIVEFLGAGCFGEVYRAKQLIFGRAFREVALKPAAIPSSRSRSTHLRGTTVRRRSVIRPE